LVNSLLCSLGKITHSKMVIKKNGFMICHPNNICARRLHDVGNNYKGNIEYTNFDYENVAMKCDPNFYNPKNRFYIIYGSYSIGRRCLYGRDILFEYF